MLFIDSGLNQLHHLRDILNVISFCFHDNVHMFTQKNTEQHETPALYKCTCREQLSFD